MTNVSINLSDLLSGLQTIIIAVLAFYAELLRRRPAATSPNTELGTELGAERIATIVLQVLATVEAERSNRKES